MARYAEGTSVSVDRSIEQIRRLLLGAGATHYMYGEGPEHGGIQFALKALHYRFTVRRPKWTDLEGRYREPGRVHRADAVENEWRRRWRARHLWVKAMLEFADVEPDSFADAMLANLVLPDGRTFGSWAVPQIEAAYSDGQMPPLLLGSGPETR